MYAAIARLLLQDDHHDDGDYHAAHGLEDYHDDHYAEDYHDDHGDHDHDHGHEGDGDTLDLRIAAIFVVLVAGLIGGLIPLLFKPLRDPSQPAAMLLRSLAAGVILALALIHVIPEGSANLESLVDYPVGPCCVIFGVLVMVVIDNMSRHLLARMHTGWPGHGHASLHNTKLGRIGDEEHDGPSPSAGAIRLGDGLQPREHERRAASAQSLPEAASRLQQGLAKGGDDASLAARRSADGGWQHTDSMLCRQRLGMLMGDVDQKCAGTDNSRHPSGVAVCAVSGVPLGDGQLEAACAREHSHGCIAVATAANFAAHAEFALATSRVSAYLFEIACLVHNVLIGFALGVTVNGRGEVTALLVAFLFHQLLEGIGLGTVIAKGFALSARDFARPRAHLSMHPDSPTDIKAGALKESSSAHLGSLGSDGKAVVAKGVGLQARLMDMLHTEAFKAVAMVVMFAATMPVGIAIGIGVASSYDPDSTVSKAVQGVLSAVSGGLLLYIALVQMITEDFTKTNGEVPGGWVVRISSYLLLAVGAAAMAVIAIFEGDSHAH